MCKNPLKRVYTLIYTCIRLYERISAACMIYARRAGSDKRVYFSFASLFWIREFILVILLYSGIVKPIFLTAFFPGFIIVFYTFYA